MDFAAIDFETANQRPDSPCQLAVVVVESGQIIAERSWLIRPKRLYFSDLCIAVHGILPEQVADQPEWDQLWPEIWSMIDGRVLIAHNASFDLRVLCATLMTYEIACPEMEYGCTRLIARRTWPGRSGYGLKPTAERLGIEFRHHDALEDSRTCAKILLAASHDVGAQTLDDLDDRLSIARGRVRFGTMTNPRSLRRSKSSQGPAEPSGQRLYRRDGWPESTAKVRKRLSQVDTILSETSTQGPLVGKSVVLTGSLLGLERPLAVQFLERLGAVVQAKINLETDYVIVGHAVSSSMPENQEPEGTLGRTDEVTARQSQGQPIRVLSQRQLLGLIPGGLEAARAISGAT